MGKITEKNDMTAEREREKEAKTRENERLWVAKLKKSKKV